MTNPTIDELRRWMIDGGKSEPVDQLREAADGLANSLDDWRYDAELHRQIVDTWQTTNDEAERATAAEGESARQFLAELRRLVDATVYAFSSYATDPARSTVRTHLRAALNLWLGVDELADALESYRYEQVTP